MKMFPFPATQPPPWRAIRWDPVCLMAFYAYKTSVEMSLCSALQVQSSSADFFNIIIDFIEIFVSTQSF